MAFRHRRSALKAIRQFCYRCLGKSWKSVAECEDRRCQLWPFRFGKLPKQEIAEQSKEFNQVIGRDK
ncbi:hypothetical protein CEE37_05850 [candidate division LCP-89 bacterium B3_LCP]|uniref:Uncharacterized protein n=1 Tax=candidate division LCP-89 bacterium B3_LCP TaxID=2012998 RepID=A0A532V2G8_UNCL8|nr:MAG: hypothetical protein CEE37_05850 [candidate division LCP-89 bacterium B3_LCP]